MYGHQQPIPYKFSGLMSVFNKGETVKFLGWGVLGLALTASVGAWAACPNAANYEDILSTEQVMGLYDICATYMNDDETQVLLARRYALGTHGVKKDLNQALYYYQLSAENGNAESQAQLAKLYIELDKTPETRKLLKKYLSTIKVTPRIDSPGQRYPEEEFQGELIHPYTLLLLANERPENKWFYPSKIRKAPSYVDELLQSYKVTDEKKQKQTRAAVAWKKRKLLERATYLLTKKEYDEFKNTLYPAEGKADPVAREQALAAFKKRYEEETKGK